MNMLILKNNEPTAENILSLIEIIKQIERENGLTEKQIIDKYTHNDCLCLATMINYVLPTTKMVMLVLDEDCFHCFVCADLKEKTNGLPQNKYANFAYFDINGKKSFEQACEYVCLEFNTDTQNVVPVEVKRPILENDIKQKLLSLVDIENKPPVLFE